MPWHINLKELEAARLSLRDVMEQGDVVHLHMDSMARGPDKFKPFKPCLKTIHICADNLWLMNA